MAVIGLEGYQSARFSIERGVRQGCPLSPLLFNILTEVLAAMVRQSKVYRGMRIQDIERRVMLYADDVVFIMTSPEQTLKTMKKLTSQYGNVAGYKINKTKSIILSINLDESTRKEIQTYDSTP